jgi:hypothetical protein
MCYTCYNEQGDKMATDLAFHVWDYWQENGKNYILWEIGGKLTFSEREIK